MSSATQLLNRDYLIPTACMPGWGLPKSVHPLFTMMQSESHIATPSSAASGMVEDRSTGSEHDQVVDHSPSALGVVGDGSTGPKKFVGIPAHQIHIDGFSKCLFFHGHDKPMKIDSYLCPVPCANFRSPLAYANKSIFKEHSRSTYEGLIFSHFFFFECSLTVFIPANSATHANNPETSSIVRLEHWTLRFPNTARHYTHVHQFNEDDNKLYCYDPLPCRWDQIPDLGNHFQFNDFTCIPFPLNSKAPHWPYIVHCLDDPLLPTSADIIFISSNNYKLSYAYASSLVAFTDRSRTRFQNWQGIVVQLEVIGCDIDPTPPLGMIGSPQGVIEGQFPSLS
jgi:hypothetical protein